MIKVTDFNSINVGDVFVMVTPQFESANIVVCISNDHTGLNRGIKHFAFVDRSDSIPTPEKFAEDMQNNISVPHTFALWDFGIEKHSMLYQFENPSHVKFCVSATLGDSDVFINYETYQEALEGYKNVLTKEKLYTANLSIVLKSTD